MNIKERLEVDIAKQRRKVAAWQELCATEGDEDVPMSPQMESLLDLGGLTEAVKTVLRGSRKKRLNTTEIMNGLRELGFPLDKYKAPMASITTTVNRLVPNEVSVYRLPNPAGNEYEWVGPASFLDGLGKGLAEAMAKAGTSEVTISQPAPNSLAAMDAAATNPVRRIRKI